MKWILKAFQNLTIEEFYEIARLRINIFIVEQNCPYSELDGKDALALHFFAVANDQPLKIVAYTRLFKAGDYYEHAAIGRVVVDADFRNQKLGHELIRRSIEQIENNFGTSKIKIGAQAHLKKFYEAHGFIQIGTGYLEDGIPHIYMVREK
ncbi:MAG: GNAT family N-acetyltransferase [Flavobacteriaceae bacterium]|nr:GNAT family N-acetyltransferase [Flavobacteriaceae bacterium]